MIAPSDGAPLGNHWHCFKAKYPHAELKYKVMLGGVSVDVAGSHVWQFEAMSNGKGLHSLT